MKKIKLSYFRPSGKFYASGELMWPDDQAMFKLFDHIKYLQQEGDLPGLVKFGGKAFYIHVDADMHPRDYPALILPLE